MRISFMFHTEWHGHGGRKLAKEGLVTRCKCANALHQDFCFFRELVYQHTTAKKQKYVSFQSPPDMTGRLEQKDVFSNSL